MAKVPLATQAAITAVNFGTTTYYALGLTGCVPNGTEARMQKTYHTAGTLNGMYLYISSNSVNGNSTFRVRKNGADGNQVIVVSSSATGEFEDTTNSDTVADGDEINYSLVTAGSSGSITPGCIITNFASSSDTVAVYSNSNIASQNFNTTMYRALSDSAPDTNTTEARATFQFNSATTLQKLFVYVTTNTIATSATTVRIRNGASNGNCSVSIAAGATGIFEDTSHTDSIAANSNACFQSVTPNTSGAIVYGLISIEGVSTSSVFHSIAGNANGSNTSTSVNYFPVVGRGYASTSESSVTRDLRIAGNATNLRINISANTANGTSVFLLRKNGADSALTLSIGATATGDFEDTSNSVSFISTDSVCLKMTRGGTGTITSRTAGLMFTNTETVTTTQTITGLARITANTLKTITGIARITATTLKTITGKSRIGYITQKTLSGISRITSKTLKTITGVSRVTITTLRTITGISRIQKVVNQTITGVANINTTVATDRTITGISRVQVVVQRTIAGIARITAKTNRTIAGISRITISTLKTINGIARVVATTTRTITGVARIRVTVLKTITGIARVTVTTLKTIQGIARVSITTTRTITGKARVGVTTTQTEIGKARVQATTQRTEQGTSRITNILNKVITGVSRISKTVSQTITGIAKITVTVSRTIFGVARIHKTTDQTEDGKARIEVTNTQNITGVARIYKAIKYENKITYVLLTKQPDPTIVESGMRFKILFTRNRFSNVLKLKSKDINVLPQKGENKTIC